MIKFIDLQAIARDINNTFAHTNGTKVETLKEHLDNCAELLIHIDNIHKVELKIRKSFSSFEIKKKGKSVFLSNEDIDFIVDMFFNTIYLHDIGKINPKFQLEKMKNSKFNNVIYSTSIESHHAPLSAIIFLNEFYNRLKNEPLKEKLILRMLMLCFANSIYCHHGILQDLEDNFSEDCIEEMLNTYAISEYLIEYKNDIKFNKSIGDVFGRIKRLGIDFNTQIIFATTKIVNSLLIAVDFISTHCFHKNTPVKDFKFALIKDVKAMNNAFHNTTVYKGMAEYQKDKDFFKKNNLPLINELRSDIAIECSKNIELNKHVFNMFNIEAPTGSGKTYNSLGCALNLLEIEEFKRMTYISPINSVSNQTKVEYEKIFKGIVDVQEVNSLMPLPERVDTKGEVDYEKTLLDRQLLNYDITFTSHISLFDMFFGISRENSMCLFQVFDSVVILDEIQNYKNSIWKETIEMLYTFSDIMNIKFIIMSATLPNLQELIRFDNKRFIDLLSSPKRYYENPLFKDRVIIDGSMLSKKVSLAYLKTVMVNAINERYNKHSERGQIFLAEFITKKSAMEFYHKIKDELSPDEFEIYELDSDNSTYSKKELIEIIKNYNGKKHLILVTTQVIEAGVDIDADLGMKDAVFPDVDEQFMGRINRSGTKKDCKVFFFNLDSEPDIYSGDLRIGTNIKEEKFLNCLKEKQFKEVLYKEVIRKVEKLKTSSCISDIEKFDKEELLYQKFSDVQRRMKLIDSNTITVYIPITSVEIKDSIGNKLIINGTHVWNEYTELIKSEGIRFAERAVKVSYLREKMSLFTYNLYGKGIDGLEPIGGTYYIPDGNDLISDGKLDINLLKTRYNIKK